MDKKSNIDVRIARIMFAVPALGGMLIFIGTAAVLPFIIAVLSGIFIITSKKSKRNSIVVNTFMTVGLIFLLFTPSIFKGYFKWQYPLQKFYVEKISGNSVNGFFPDKIPSDTEVFTTDFQPSIMQGAGHYSITMVTPKADAFERSAKKQAVMYFTLDEYFNGLSYRNVQLMKKISGDTSAKMSIYVPEEIYSYGDTTMIYIIESNFYWNHPHTDAVLINHNQNTVCFSRLG